MKAFYFLLLSMSAMMAQAQYCTNIPGVGGLEPPAPSLPDIFSTKIEINHIGSKKTDYARMYFDYNRRMASIAVQSDNNETKLIFDYDAKQIHKIKCKLSGPFSSLFVIIF